jgi:hypothetical protein
MRRPLLALTLAAALPAAAHSQYTVAYAPTLPRITGQATFTANVPVSETGCGTYACISVAAGRVATATLFGATFDVVQVRFTDAARAPGATTRESLVGGRSGYSICSPTGGATATNHLSPCTTSES